MDDDDQPLGEYPPLPPMAPLAKMAASMKGLGKIFEGMRRTLVAPQRETPR